MVNLNSAPCHGCFPPSRWALISIGGYFLLIFSCNNIVLALKSPIRGVVGWDFFLFYLRVDLSSLNVCINKVHCIVSITECPNTAPI